MPNLPPPSARSSRAGTPVRFGNLNSINSLLQPYGFSRAKRGFTSVFLSGLFWLKAIGGTWSGALGEMKDKQAIGSLHDAITDKGEVAFAAAKALADMGDSGGRDMFVAMIAGERSDAPGIVASGIRDARKRLKHPQGLLLAQKKLRGRCSRRRHTALPPPRRLSRRKDLPAAQSLPCTWRKTPIPTPSRYWNGPFRIPVGACARLPLRAWRRAATRRPSPNCNSSWMIRTPPYGPCPPRPYFISATKRSRLVRFVRAARRLAQVASPGPFR